MPAVNPSVQSPVPMACRRSVLAWLVGAGVVPLPAVAADRLSLTIGTTGGTPSTLAVIAERVVTEACRRAEIALQVTPLPLLRSLDFANRGEIDGDMMRIAEAVEPYPNLIRVPVPVASADVVFYGREGLVQGLTRERIRALQVAYTRGTLILARHAKDMRNVEVGTIDQVFGMLAAGRVDLAMATYVNGEEAMRRLSPAGIVRWPQVWASEPLYLMLNRRHEALVPRLAAALQAMSQDGTIERITREELAAQGIQPLPAMTGGR